MRVRVGASAPASARAGLIEMGGRPAEPGIRPVADRRPENIAASYRQEEGNWWDRWRHRGAAPTWKGSTVYARSTTIQAQPLSVDIGIAHVRDVVMPALKEIDGWLGLSLLVDRQSGTCIATSSWETIGAMRGSVERV